MHIYKHTQVVAEGRSDGIGMCGNGETERGGKQQETDRRRKQHYFIFMSIFMS